eukprot:1813-Heterococcus_DN1.PRE.2
MPTTATTTAGTGTAIGRKRTAMLPSNVLMSRLVEFAQQQQHQQQQLQHGVAKGKGKGKASSSGSKRKATGSVTQRQRKSRTSVSGAAVAYGASRQSYSDEVVNRVQASSARRNGCAL